MVHQQCAELNSFSPLTLPRFSCEDVSQSALAGLSLVPVVVVLAGCRTPRAGPHQLQLLLPRLGCPIQVVTPFGFGVPAELRFDPQLPPHSAAVDRKGQKKSPRAFCGCCDELCVGLANLVLCIM